MVIFHSFWYVYQRVNFMKSHETHNMAISRAITRRWARAALQPWSPLPAWHSEAFSICIAGLDELRWVGWEDLMMNIYIYIMCICLYIYVHTYIMWCIYIYNVYICIYIYVYDVYTIYTHGHRHIFWGLLFRKSSGMRNPLTLEGFQWRDTRVLRNDDLIFTKLFWSYRWFYFSVFFKLRYFGIFR